MKIAAKSLLRPVSNEGKGYNKYAATDKKYTIAAVPTTTSKFGPSGSLKKKNSAREQRIDVTARISNEIFFDLKYMLVGMSRRGPDPEMPRDGACEQGPPYPHGRERETGQIILQQERKAEASGGVGRVA